jgi:hypothetical protein
MNNRATNDLLQRANELRMHLHVFPNVLVAWADGRLDKNERALIERIAFDSLPPGNKEAAAAYGRRLDSIPTQDEVEAWVKLVKTFLSRLSRAFRESFIAQTRKNLWLVARASGGAHPVCANERAVIARIDSILQSSDSVPEQARGRRKMPPTS